MHIEDSKRMRKALGISEFTRRSGSLDLQANQ